MSLNAYAERWVRSVKKECLSNLILLGEGSPGCASTEFIDHFYSERNHQGKGNVLSVPESKRPLRAGPGSERNAENLWVAYSGSIPTPHALFGNTGKECEDE